MRRLTVIVAVVSLCGSVVVAQKQEMPKPGPEHQRLGAFVGNWTFDGQMKPGPMGPGGKVTGEDRIEWTPGNFFIQRSFEGKSPMGEVKGIEIYAYDAAKKVYTFNSFDSIGMMGSGTMAVEGNTWTATGTSTMGATVWRDRCTLQFGTGGATLMVKCEMSTDGKEWTSTFEGTATKK